MNERDLEIATRIAKDVKQCLESHSDNTSIQMEVLRIICLDFVDSGHEKKHSTDISKVPAFTRLQGFFIQEGMGPVESLSIMCTLMSSIFAHIFENPEEAIKGLTDQLVNSVKIFKLAAEMDSNAKK
jgi:hypothetical protein